MHLDLLGSLEFVVLGALCGFLGGLFGIGGATLAIPTLGIAFGMSQQLAQGTAVAMALPNVLIGLARYQQKAGLDVRTAVLVAGTALPFTYVGALIATSVQSRPLRIAFAIFLMVVALDVGRRALMRPPSRRFALPWTTSALVGAVCGMFSGLFGIGGAFVLVAGLTMLFGYTQLAAQGMALAFSAGSGVVTALAYASKGDVDWAVSIPLAIGGALAVRRGVDLAHRLPERVLRLLFTVFAIAVAIGLILKERT